MWVINEIRLLQQNNIPWQNTLIIHATREEISHIAVQLNKAFGPKTAVARVRQQLNHNKQPPRVI